MTREDRYFVLAMFCAVLRRVEPNQTFQTLWTLLGIAAVFGWLWESRQRGR